MIKPVLIHPVYIDSKERDSYLEKVSGRRIAFIDENVFHFFQKQCAHDFDLILVIPSGESSKSMLQVEKCMDFLMSNEVDKNDCLFGVGGGVVTDLTGYISAVYKRGLSLILIPTTLLSMVDAALGGKNGINFYSIKNMIGTIKMPDAVIIDLHYLQTLPEVEWRNGFAEIIKHGLIAHKELLDLLRKHSLLDFQNNHLLLQELLAEAIQVKMDIVAADPMEEGLRKKLNFGHTFGHAFETLLNIPHGQAVMLGMYWEQYFFQETFPSEVARDCLSEIQYLSEIYYPMDFTFSGWKKMMGQINQDKKRMNKTVVMPRIYAEGQSDLKTIPLEKIAVFFQDRMLKY